MDVFKSIYASKEQFTIHTVEMHTSGERDISPTRIVVRGYPELQGETLLEKRRYASEHYDFLRTRLMLEPRGHPEMYGAILVRETELTQSGEADIGVLFCHNGERVTQLCVVMQPLHWVDSWLIRKTKVPSPNRSALRREEGKTILRLHAPCGVVEVTVPTQDDGTADHTQPVSFLSTPSFVTALDITVTIPEDELWERLRLTGRTEVRLSVAYGGAFYVFVEAQELGFSNGLKGYSIEEVDRATFSVKKVVGAMKDLLKHPQAASGKEDLEYLYGVVVVDKAGNPESEMGLCIFADQQVDRSPCGSAVSARVALGIAREDMSWRSRRLYDSPVSKNREGMSFWGEPVSKTDDGIIVRVSGTASYTGVCVWLAERGDGLRNGFKFELP